jgi:putative peptide zinc metalloprotease protein
MLAVPAYRPDSDDLYFLSSPVFSLGALAVWAMLSTAGHEVAHWLAARAQGVPARFSIGRRLYFLVFETDLSQLWGLPRRRRFAPLLAGLAYDTVILSGLLAVQLISSDELVDRVAAALVAVEVSGILFQFLVFLRTDLYAVLVMLFGCRDLWRVNSLELRRIFGRLDKQQAAELAKAHPRDRRVATWFRWLSIAGLAAAAGYLVAFFLPALWTLLRWITESLSTAAPTTGRFWQSVVFAALALTPLALLIGVATRERISRRHRTKSRSR